MASHPESVNHNPMQQAWWKEAIIYHIYPPSFCDSNGDGVGDLQGIISKLDYLKYLGVDIIWLSPIYKSPQADMGFDISDYHDIDPRYGTLEDWDRLVKGLQERKIKLMMDQVVNHTSNEHAWFKESRSNKINPKRDWYIWRPARYDEQGNRHPPNNWKSIFQGSSWTWDEATQEYYLHLYLASQPDLNWENHEVRRAIWDMMRSWLDRGTDGFRFDVINKISKVPGLPDAPISDPKEKYQVASMHHVNGPRVHEFVKEINTEVLSKYRNIIAVGEASLTHDMNAIAEYALPDNHELNMIFHFELMEIDRSSEAQGHLVPKKWELAKFKEIVNRWQTFLRGKGFWNCVYLQNHGQPRCVSRFGNDSPAWRTLSAKMLAIFEISQSGTLYVYQGEEIGMANIPRSWSIEEYKDIATQNYYKRVLHKRKEVLGDENPDMTDVLDGIQKRARDNARTPMQWNNSKNAGFSDGTPWMRVNGDYTEWNVSAQRDDPESVLSFWVKLLRLRKANAVLIYGDFTLVDESDNGIFAFWRMLEDLEALVLLNFTNKPIDFQVPYTRNMALGTPMASKLALLISNYVHSDAGSDIIPGHRVKLQGYEGRIYVSNKNV